MGQEPTLNPEEIDALVERESDDEARLALAHVASEDERYAVVRIKLGLRDGSLPPGVAMQKLVQIMRKEAAAPGAKALYQEASRLSFQEGASSTSHSHPPPPVVEK